ncbi:hypothetical protein [Acinetobacter pittii]|uniref:hypothetical protein n=1 Tax=Acinetobacter pittii TaxID=48296 RepID=UPI001EE4FE93|nr:hypothetical protein [Acinetobacter pittii]MCG5226197.1 hypothetical protein [Acinetobacter pittii]
MNKTEVENTLTEHNGFVEAKEYILNQVKKPVKHVTFWLFFFVGILILAASGFWFELFRYLKLQNSTDGMKAALIFFVLPLVNTAALQFVLTKALKKSVKASVCLVAIILDLLCWGLLYFDPSFTSWSYICIISIVLIISLLIAWLQSSLNEDFYDCPTPDAPLGGDTASPLQGEIPSDFQS